MLISDQDILASLVNQAEHLWALAILGCESQNRHGIELLGIMKSEPRIGWLVVVGHVGSDVPAANRIGWLSKVEEFPCRERDEDEEFAPLARRWTIERLDGSGEFTWVNVAVRCFPQRKWHDGYGYVPVSKGMPIYS